MYIVWRKRMVKGNKTTSFLQDVIPHESAHATPWKPMVCTHRGEGRVAWTPLIMHSARWMGGQPRQTLVRRLPSIRSCCAADRFLRAAWWYDVERTLGESEGTDHVDIRYAYAREKKHLLAQLCEVVPRPTPAGVRDFTAYRMKKEQEHRARMTRNRAEAEAFHAEQRRLHEEARRRAEEQQRAEQQRYWQQWQSQWSQDFWRRYYQNHQPSSDQVAQPDCFEVLRPAAGRHPGAGQETA